MATESVSSHEYDIHDAQERLERIAGIKAASYEKALDQIPPIQSAAVDMHQLFVIPTLIYEVRARDWLSRVEDIRELRLVHSSNPEVIFGKLPTGENIFLSRYHTSFGARRRVYGIVDSTRLSDRKARKELRRYLSPLKKRKKLVKSKV